MILQEMVSWSCGLAVLTERPQHIRQYRHVNPLFPACRHSLLPHSDTLEVPYRDDAGGRQKGFLQLQITRLGLLSLEPLGLKKTAVT